MLFDETRMLKNKTSLCMETKGEFGRQEISFQKKLFQIRQGKATVKAKNNPEDSILSLCCVSQ